MTPELEKVMNEAAIKNANGLRNLERDFSIGDFKAGFFLAIAHLEKQAGIFPVDDIERAYGKLMHTDDAWSEWSGYKAGAQLMFERMKYSTQLAWEQVAATENRYEELYEITHEQMNADGKRIQFLEARLAEMTEKYNKAYGSYSKHFDAMIHNHKMYEEVATKLTAAEARIKEYSQLIRDKGIR